MKKYIEKVEVIHQRKKNAITRLLKLTGRDIFPWKRVGRVRDQ